MANADRTTSPINGISFIKKNTQDKGKRRKLRDDEIAYERLLNCDSYTGTATALINAGLIAEHMLPDPASTGSKTAVTMGPDETKWGPGFIEITRKNARLFDVKIGLSKEENDFRQKARDRQLEAEAAEKRFEAAQRCEALELSELPRSHEQYRERCISTLRAHITIVRDTAIVPNKYSGFHFDGKALRAFDEAVEMLFKTLVYGGTQFDPAAQAQRIVEIKSQSSKANLPLQNFLQNITALADDEQSTAENGDSKLVDED